MKDKNINCNELLSKKYNKNEYIFQLLGIKKLQKKKEMK